MDIADNNQKKKIEKEVFQSANSYTSYTDLNKEQPYIKHAPTEELIHWKTREFFTPIMNRKNPIRNGNYTGDFQYSDQ